MNDHSPNRRPALVLLALLALLLAGCGASQQPSAAAPTGAATGDAAPTSAPAAAPSGDKITIKLAENSWTGSSVNVNVAKILLEKQLGYTVEIVTIDENAQWAALSSGDLSASLEVWPSGHAENVKTYITDQKQV